MIVEFIVDENDFLQYQLFTASKSERVKKLRKKSLFYVTLIFFGLSIFFICEKNKIMFISFVLCGIITLIFYPFYLRRHYKNHYLSFIRDTYKNRLGQLIRYNISYEVINSDSPTTFELKFDVNTFEEFNEISSHFFLKFKTGESLIISKNKISNLPEIKNELIQISEKYNIKFNVELDWKWK